MNLINDYSMFFNFVDKYIGEGFASISRQDPFIVEMEKKLALNHQFFYVGDLIKLKVLFTFYISFLLPVPHKLLFIKEDVKKDIACIVGSYFCL